MNEKTRTYAVLDSAQGDEQATVQRLLASMRRFLPLSLEYDIVKKNQSTWPDEVRSAATMLLSLAGDASPPEQDYVSRLRVSIMDNNTWQKVFPYLGYALDASIANSDGVRLIKLADEGESVVLYLSNEEVEDLENDLGPSSSWLSAHPPRRSITEHLRDWWRD